MLVTCPHCGGKIPTKPGLPKVSIITKKHPTGMCSPTGKRQVRTMSVEYRDGKSYVTVQVMHNGSLGGWDFVLGEAHPWAVFNINGSSQPQCLTGAWTHWVNTEGPSS